jgi:hypothetical protein
LLPTLVGVPTQGSLAVFWLPPAPVVQLPMQVTVDVPFAPLS